MECSPNALRLEKALDQDQMLVTPSRKPTEHNCMADKKPHPRKNISNDEIRKLAKKLFLEETEKLKTVPKVNARNLR